MSRRHRRPNYDPPLLIVACAMAVVLGAVVSARPVEPSFHSPTAAPAGTAQQPGVGGGLERVGAEATGERAVPQPTRAPNPPQKSDPPTGTGSSPNAISAPILSAEMSPRSSSQPSATPTPEPSTGPDPTPSSEPSVEPTEPSVEPTPSGEPSEQPSVEPTPEASPEPSPEPSASETP